MQGAPPAAATRRRLSPLARAGPSVPPTPGRAAPAGGADGLPGAARGEGRRAGQGRGYSRERVRVHAARRVDAVELLHGGQRRLHGRGGAQRGRARAGRRQVAVLLQPHLQATRTF